MARHLLLISNSTQPGQSYLEHCAGEITAFLGDVRAVLFVPYARHDLDTYAATARSSFATLGFKMTSVHDAYEPVAAVRAAEAIFVGGGNTFRLLDRLYRLGLVDAIRDRVAAEARYVGTSAGTNVAGPTIKTTNDMPIVYPPTFEAIDLVPFNINPHYVDRDPDVPHGGETREQRIAEFHEEDPRPVVGLREQAMLLVDGDTVELRGGAAGARVFRRGRQAHEYRPGDRLDALL